MLRKILILGVLISSIIFSLPRAECSTDLIKTYTVENDTAQVVTSYVSVLIIIPDQSRIFSYNVCPTRSNPFSPYVSLWDMKSTTLWDASSLIGESESLPNSSLYKPYPYPKNISNQLKVVLGPYSAVIIEYTK